MSTTELETRVIDVAEQAKAIVIRTHEDYRNAAGFLVTVKGLLAEIDNTFQPIITKAHEAHKEAISQRNRSAAPLVLAEQIVKPVMAEFIRTQERLKAEEDRRREIAAKEEAERQMLVEAAHLDAIGETKAANKLLQQPVVVAPFTPAPAPPKAEGISMRETWSVAIDDLMTLVKAVAAGKAPIQCLSANTVFLGQQARAMKSALRYPGVRPVSSTNVSARRSL